MQESWTDAMITSKGLGTDLLLLTGGDFLSSLCLGRNNPTPSLVLTTLYYFHQVLCLLGKYLVSKALIFLSFERRKKRLVSVVNSIL